MLRKLGVAAVLLMLMGLVASAGDGGKIEWTHDYEKGLKAAKESGKAVMLYFTADW